MDGWLLGRPVGLLGFAVGTNEGPRVGGKDGSGVGSHVGAKLGPVDGLGDGRNVGVKVGLEGANVGAREGDGLG
jgi:hypothetical protein